MYFFRMFEMGVNTAKAITELMAAFNRLKGMIAGISILPTVSTPAPRKIPVKRRLRGIITTVIASVPSARPMMSEGIVFFLR